jgi:hypothetical protein
MPQFELELADSAGEAPIFRTLALFRNFRKGGSRRSCG